MVTDQVNMCSPLENKVKMSYPPALSNIADQLVEAISPAISGNFERNIMETHTEGVIFIYIEGEPKFDSLGKANYNIL